jgi:predicted transcriptional regulator
MDGVCGVSLEAAYQFVALLKAKPRTVAELMVLSERTEKAVRRHVKAMEAQCLIEFDGFRDIGERGNRPTVYRWKQ